MKAVWKYILDVTDTQHVPMPRGAELLAVACQHGRLVLWARVEPTSALVNRFIYVCGTGNPAPIAARFVGTAVMADGALVWHVFDGGEPG